MRRKRSWLSWIWSLTRVSLVILFIWLWLRYQEEQEKEPALPIELKDDDLPQKSPAEISTIPSEAADVHKPATKPDDLTRIKGIGPKTANILQQAGITSYQELAGTSIQEVMDLLEKANYRLLDPTTWIEQARLAADGAWEELDQLQQALKNKR